MRTPDTLTPTPPKANEDTLQGLIFAATAYGLWGFLPIYMKIIDHIPVVEVLINRVLWSVPIAALVLIILRRTDALKEALRTPRMLGMACVTAGLISINWGVYIWAIVNGQALDAALGYYINPLFSIFLGSLLLGERLSRAQLAAIALAALGVLVITLDAGGIPWVALALTVSWGFYALAKKSLPIGPNQGFLLEVLVLSPPALGYLAYLTWVGQSHLSLSFDHDTWLLMGCGVVTAVPLLFYANGAKLLRLSTIGILQYIAPTMIFLVAVFIFDEPFGQARMIAFPMIWLALVIYTTAMIRHMRVPRAGEVG